MATTTPSSPLVATAKGLAIAASFITTGSLFTTSSGIIPSILHSTTDDASSAQTAAQQFALTHRAGKRTLPLPRSSAAMFSVIPWTVVLMEEGTQRLVRLADAPPHSAQKSPSLEHKPEASTGGLLNIPGQSAAQRPAITPVEEFEPFEDAPFSAEEYEKAKVQKMLKQWNGRNGIRLLGPLIAGVLGLWATLAE
ncbi:hypothetical protein Q7P37_008225 [Cladosporium fusiforme]